MNTRQHQQAVQEAVKGKFRGDKPLPSKAIPMYPNSAEREYKRITNGYIKLLNETLKKHLPKMLEAYKKERHGDSRFDDMRDLDNDIRQEIQSAAEELEQKMASYGLDKFIRQVANMTKTTSIREWKRVVKQTLGIDLFDDYYKGDFYEEALRRWIDENILKIKSMPTETLGSMREIILNGFAEGKTIRTITDELQNAYNLTKSKAKMLARDQLSTLNSQISQIQQKDAGCEKYRWSTSKDSRVRDCHRELHGKIISWDEPPEMWYMTKKAGKVYTGRRCHPGEDYCCRCVAIPVFDLETVDVPIKPQEK